MKKRLVSLLLTLALLVLPVVSAGAAQPDPTLVQTQTETAEAAQHQYSYIALGDSIVAGSACRMRSTSGTAGTTMCPATTRATPRIAMWPGWPRAWA